MQTRKAAIEELDLLVPLFDKYRVFYEKGSDIEKAKDFLLQRIINNEAVLFICLDDRQPVGFTLLYPLFSSTRMKKLWLLNDLYVEEAYRGKRYSLALISAAKEFCKETEACGLILETSKENIIGNSLYLKTGFNLDTEHNFYSWDTNDN